jgi:hypothetical protein
MRDVSWPSARRRLEEAFAAHETTGVLYEMKSGLRQGSTCVRMKVFQPGSSQPSTTNFDQRNGEPQGSDAEAAARRVAEEEAMES